MTKKSLWKDTLREIVHSKARFLSILAIIMLGVAFFSGISAAGPDMLSTAGSYYKDQHLMDMKIVSTLGLTKEDVALLSETKNAHVEPLYTQDVLFKGTSLTSHVIGYDPAMKINRPLLTEGRMPEKKGEITLDSTILYREKFNVGDTISFETENISSDPSEVMDHTTFDIVGFAKNPMYIEETNRGSTSLGSGVLRGVSYVLEEEFSSEYYTEAFLTFDDLAPLVGYSDAYETAMVSKTKEMEAQLEDRPKERFEELREEIQKEIDKGRKETEDARKELANAESTLESERKKLDDSKARLQKQNKDLQAAEQNIEFLPPAEKQAIQQARAQLDAGFTQIESGEAEYEKARRTFEEEKASALEEIEDAEAELNEAEETRNTLKAPEYFVLDRSDNPGYSEYEDNADRMGSIAKVFPVFFFLLAALISLTTLTRMVEEERSHIGTLKALGYTNGDISFKYFFYALAATVIGVSLGLSIGFTLFPTIVFNAYGSMYNLPPVQLSFYWSYALLSLGVSLISTGVSALVAVRVSLQSNAAELLRRKAPKMGKRIWLERIPFIWNRMSFTKKVAARNLFRYKQRMLMTVFGVAGCTGLILTGFGLSDSISGIADVQYGELSHYEAIVALNADASDEEKTAYQDVVDTNTSLSDSLNVRQESVDAHADSPSSKSYEATLFVPEEKTNFSSFVTLRTPGDKQPIELSDDGVVITEKLARLLSLSEGDIFTIENNDHRQWELPIVSITENYVGHTIYMSPAFFEGNMQEELTYNTQLLSYVDGKVDEEKLGNELTEQDSVIGLNMVSMIYDAFSETLQSLDIVTILLVVSAALLAIVVLYNLTNINVSERIRELSTIKVLGFYDSEVTMYIYRENFVLTIMGIVAGLAVGVLLHRFVLQTAEVDMLMFSRIIHLSSYVYAALLTFFFSTVVMLIMHRKLKKVDMVEALKAQE